MKLSAHFSLAELIKTSVRADNSPTPEHLANLRLAAYGMENVRRLLGNFPIIVTSGYRNPTVNRAVGGVSNSDHALGYAVDFKHTKLDAKTCCRAIVDSPIVFDQLILERNDSLVHISFNPRARRQVLRQPGGPGTKFYQGLGDGG